jgi:hypothetical protein
MIEQLSNKNESATVAKIQKFCKYKGNCELFPHRQVNLQRI